MTINKVLKNTLKPSDEEPFKIISDYKENGDQPNAIKNLVQNLETFLYQQFPKTLKMSDYNPLLFVSS